MADENAMLKARQTYQNMVAMFEKKNWNFRRDDEKMVVSCSASGDDLPLDVRMSVDAERKLVMMLSKMPYTVPEEKRVDVALAVAYVNNRLINGGFDYDIRNGMIFFRMVSSFDGCELGNEAFRYMLTCSCTTTDDYNDKFFMIATGTLSIDKFMEEKSN